MLWSYDAQDAEVQFSAPVVANGVIYLAGQSGMEGHAGRLVALDEETGAVKWDVAYDNLTMAEPLVQGERVLAVDTATGHRRVLLGVDAASGQTFWRGPIPRGDLTVTETRVWLITVDDEAEFTGQIRLDAVTGQQLTETKIEKAGFVHPEIVFGVEAINGRLYQNTSGRVYAIGSD